nr:unnamed protein product [Spirometra erinaceieuropaei]
MGVAMGQRVNRSIAVRQLAIVGGRNEADFLRNLLTVLLGPLLCHNFCWAGGSKEKKSFVACPLFPVLKDAIAQHPRFGNCTIEIFRRTAIRWFHGSQDRYGGRSTRRRNIRQITDITIPAATCPQLSPAKEPVATPITAEESHKETKRRRGNRVHVLAVTGRLFLRFYASSSYSYSCSAPSRCICEDRI